MTQFNRSTFPRLRSSSVSPNQISYSMPKRTPKSQAIDSDGDAGSKFIYPSIELWYRCGHVSKDPHTGAYIRLPRNEMVVLASRLNQICYGIPKPAKGNPIEPYLTEGVHFVKRGSSYLFSEEG